MGEPKKKNVWNKILIVVVILGIIFSYLSYSQDKKMDKMLEELDRKKIEQIDPIEIQNLWWTNFISWWTVLYLFTNCSPILIFWENDKSSESIEMTGFRGAQRWNRTTDTRIFSPWLVNKISIKTIVYMSPVHLPVHQIRRLGIIFLQFLHSTLKKKEWAI